PAPLPQGERGACLVALGVFERLVRACGTSERTRHEAAASQPRVPLSPCGREDRREGEIRREYGPPLPRPAPSRGEGSSANVALPLLGIESLYCLDRIRVLGAFVRAVALYAREAQGEAAG